MIEHERLIEGIQKAWSELTPEEKEIVHKTLFAGEICIPRSQYEMMTQRQKELMHELEVLREVCRRPIKVEMKAKPIKIIEREEVIERIPEKIKHEHVKRIAKKTPALSKFIKSIEKHVGKPIHTISEKLKGFVGEIEEKFKHALERVI